MKNEVSVTIPHFGEVSLWRPYYREIIQHVIEFTPPWKKGRGHGIWLFSAKFPFGWELTMRGGRRKPLSDKEYQKTLREYYGSKAFPAATYLEALEP